MNTPQKVHFSKSPAFKKIFLGILAALTFCAPKANSQSWSSLPGGGANDWVYSTAVFNGDLIIGGNFTAVGGVNANHIARWDGNSWSPLGLGVNGKVNALIEYNGELYAGGEFTEAGGITMMFIAKWDGTAWSNNLGDMSSIVTAFAVYNGNLIVSGYFTDADGTPAESIAQYDGNNWSSLGVGAGGGQSTVMALDVYNNELFAGGFFTMMDGVSASHIAKWNGSNWSALGSGIQHIVYSLTHYNGDVIAGGLFMAAGGTPVKNIASWDGTSWSAMGGGMDGPFYQYVLTLTTYNGYLIAGGYFTTSDGLPTNGIAQWDGTSWSSMDGGLFEAGNVWGAHAMCVYGGNLAVGGLFLSAGAVNAANIAIWNSPPTATEHLVGPALMSAYPNPAKDVILFNVPSEYMGSKYVVSDLMGRKLRSGKTTSEKMELDISELPLGVYFLYLDGIPSGLFKIIKE